MKAIIEISQRGAVKARALSGAHTLDRGGRVSGDYRPGFETAAQLFSELTPARMVSEAHRAGHMRETLATPTCLRLSLNP